MKLLFDTHAALWWIRADERVSAYARERGADPKNRVLLSAVVVWEIAIKKALGKLEAPADVVDSLLEAGAVALPVTLEHAAGVEELPPHHNDPFDRLLIAQARAEDAVIVTRDPAFGAYGVPVLW